MTVAKKLSFKKLQTLARAHGLHAASFTGLAPLETSVKPLNAWQQAGFAAEMGYMQRPAEVLCDPQRLCPGALSAATFAVLYEQTAVPQCPQGAGRVARYAWGLDYHIVLRERLEALIKTVQREFCEAIVFRVFSDAVPLLERALAERSGLGFIGKNSLLIRPGTGSLFFLAEVLWDIEVQSEALTIAEGTCGSCKRCMLNCPTGAIVEERVVDSRRCISYLTIEKRGSFSLWEREALGEWVFGCDVCQEVCPFNHASLKEARGAILPEFRGGQIAGPFLQLDELLALRDDAKFRARFKNSPLLRPKRAGLLRNAACVAANTLAEECIPVLIEAAGNDPAPIVREHSVWALGKLDNGSAAIAAALERALADADETVRKEARRGLEGV